jgi:hypothetical protein
MVTPCDWCCKISFTHQWISYSLSDVTPNGVSEVSDNKVIGLHFCTSFYFSGDYCLKIIPVYRHLTKRQ